MALAVLLPLTNQLWLGPVDEIESIKQEARLRMNFKDECAIMAYNGVRPREENNPTWVPAVYRSEKGELWVRFTSKYSMYVHARVNIVQDGAWRRAIVNLRELDVLDLD